jgi:hypothetical protein
LREVIPDDKEAKQKLMNISVGDAGLDLTDVNVESQRVIRPMRAHQTYFKISVYYYY